MSWLTHASGCFLSSLKTCSACERCSFWADMSICRSASKAAESPDTSSWISAMTEAATLRWAEATMLHNCIRCCHQTLIQKTIKGPPRPRQQRPVGQRILGAQHPRRSMQSGEWRQLNVQAVPTQEFLSHSPAFLAFFTKFVAHQEMFFLTGDKATPPLPKVSRAYTVFVR
jgi:hypothetical protein